jgi:hypothetical protein
MANITASIRRVSASEGWRRAEPGASLAGEPGSVGEQNFSLVFMESWAGDVSKSILPLESREWLIAGRELNQDTGHCQGGLPKRYPRSVSWPKARPVTSFSPRLMLVSRSVMPIRLSDKGSSQKFRP